MKIKNWGNYPIVDAEMVSPSSVMEVKKAVCESNELIARGLGRSYGDSSLNQKIVSTLKLNHFLAFDEQSGLLTCEAGISLAEILDAFVPRGWFLPVTPGTKFVTIGGAIAADVHGKNHHVAGSFSTYVDTLKIIVSSGDIINCSRTVHPELFWATCGGMGLTGVIIEASFYLKPIETAYIRQRVIKTKNLAETFEAFENNKGWTYSVAWIDCLSKEDALGRSALILGEHALKDEIRYRYRNPLLIEKKFFIRAPFYFPDFILNTHTVKLFNELRYRTYRDHDTIVDYEPFFYPLDSIREWNKIYGKRGFTQYQFVLPRETSEEGLRKILQRISESGEGSFLAVLKLFGKQEGLLSFPKEGYTLALDFPITERTMKLFNELDALVQNFGGRLYLAKDVRMNKDVFSQGYENLKQFVDIKQHYDPANKFHSLQSKRIMG